MSLIELMVGVAISSFVIVGAGALLTFAMGSFVRIIDQNAAEESLLTAAYALRTVATQAVDLYGVNAITMGAQGGQILNPQADPTSSASDFNSVGLAADDTFNIAAFKRQAVAQGIPPYEIGGAAFTIANNFRETGIFFKTPRANCIGQADDFRACSGNLIITLGTEAGNANATIPATVDDGPTLRYENFVSLLVRTTSVANGNPSYAREATFTLTVRYFLSGNRSQYIFLPNPPAGTQNYKDKSMEVFIGFRNNYLGPSQLATGDPERLHGSLYYFPFQIPRLHRM